LEISSQIAYCNNCCQRTAQAKPKKSGGKKIKRKKRRTSQKTSQVRWQVKVHAATRRAFNNIKLVLGWGAKPEFIIKRQNAGKAFFAASSSCHRCKIFVYHIAIIAAGEVKTKSWIRGFMCRGAEHRAKGSKHPNIQPSEHRSDQKKEKPKNEGRIAAQACADRGD